MIFKFLLLLTAFIQSFFQWKLKSLKDPYLPQLTSFCILMISFFQIPSPFTVMQVTLSFTLIVVLHKLVKLKQFDNLRTRRRIFLSRDLESILKWLSGNLVKFNSSNTLFCILFSKSSNNFHWIFMGGAILQNIVGVTFACKMNLCKYRNIYGIIYMLYVF